MMKSLKQYIQERDLHRKPGVQFAYSPDLRLTGVHCVVNGVPLLSFFKDGGVCSAVHPGDLIALPESLTLASLIPVKEIRTGDLALTVLGPCFVSKLVVTDPPTLVLLTLLGEEVRIGVSGDAGLHVVRPKDLAGVVPGLAHPGLRPHSVLGAKPEAGSTDVVDVRKPVPTHLPCRSRIVLVSEAPGERLPPVADLAQLDVERVGTLGTADEYRLKALVPLRGAKYRSATEQQVLLSLVPTNRLTFVREPQNPHDRNAIAVYRNQAGSPRKKGTWHVGHVPRELAALLAPVLDAGVELQGTLKTAGTLAYDECLMELRLRVPHSMEVRTAPKVSTAMGLGDVFVHPKHLGKTLAQVVLEDPGYVEWMCDMGHISLTEQAEAALRRATR